MLLLSFTCRVVVGLTAGECVDPSLALGWCAPERCASPGCQAILNMVYSVQLGLMPQGNSFMRPGWLWRMDRGKGYACSSCFSLSGWCVHLESIQGNRQRKVSYLLELLLGLRAKSRDGETLDVLGAQNCPRGSRTV